MSPSVSLLMANYNGAAYIPAAIASLKAQTLGDWELIFVDDLSTDDSLAVLGRASAGDRRIRVFSQPGNAGPAAARNRALDEAAGAWVAIFDSDDEMEPQRLATLVAAAVRHEADIVADNLMLVSSDGELPFLKGLAGRASRWIDLAGFVDSNTLYSRVADLGYLKPLIRRERIGAERYDESLRIGEDYDLLARLIAKCGRMWFEAQPLYRYRRHDQSISQRLTPDDLTGLLAANERFASRHGQSSPAVHRAIERRRHSLEALIAYDAVISGLKGADRGRAITSALSQPKIWRLLGRPIKARVDRARRALKPAAAGAEGKLNVRRA